MQKLQSKSEFWIANLQQNSSKVSDTKVAKRAHPYLLQDFFAHSSRFFFLYFACKYNIGQGSALAVWGAKEKKNIKEI